jgi:hypothetical protein
VVERRKIVIDEKGVAVIYALQLPLCYFWCFEE